MLLQGHTLVFDIIGVDDGFENPKFACLEVDYEEADGDPTGAALADTQQSLTIYELDLGLNHVVRKQSTPLDVLANRLITVSRIPTPVIPPTAVYLIQFVL